MVLSMIELFSNSLTKETIKKHTRSESTFSLVFTLRSIVDVCCWDVKVPTLKLAWVSGTREISRDYSHG